jgi:tRNA dimethylallyltransferase
MAPSKRPESILVAGPTAVGKSAVAIELAARLGGEIVSVDSMQVYRSLNTGTAKPTEKDRARVPHHLIDVADLSEAFDVARFVTLARAAVADISGRGKLPILCGGTGLYFKAFLEGLGAAPPSDAALREELKITPISELLRELKKRDPVSYQKIDRQNPRRIIRAVEVVRLTGRPFSEQRSEWKRPDEISSRPVDRGGPGRETIMVGLTRTPEDLRQRIDVRVDEMFRRGLVEETRDLLRQGLAESRTASQALGYRQVIEYHRGERPFKETVELVKVRTRQFAKRQMTWFRRQMPLQWVQLGPTDTPETIANSLLKNTFFCGPQDVIV